MSAAARTPQDPRSTSAVTSRTGPRRSESVRLAVLHAADDLLVERGFAGLTIEGIANRAGVAKQTIYRWWKSKVEILLDTLADDAHEALAWHAGEDLATHLRRLADFFQEPSGHVLRSLLGHAQLDAEAAESLREGFLREQRRRDVAGLRATLERQLGTPVDEAAAESYVDLLLGPLYYRVLVLGRPAGKQVTETAARRVLDLARAELGAP
ncbi:TetR family transcriptional regulator [Streptomyces sp. CC77]|nr:TetR family transcriptional regulator [Streptomyces sp. CC77]